MLSRVAVRASRGRRFLSVPVWATVDPATMSAAAQAIGKNLVGGKWMETATQHKVMDPLNGEDFMLVPNTQSSEIGPFVERMLNCPRHGLHNPIKNPERYNMLGEVMVKGAGAGQAGGCRVLREADPAARAQVVPAVRRRAHRNA